MTTNASFFTLFHIQRCNNKDIIQKADKGKIIAISDRDIYVNPLSVNA